MNYQSVITSNNKSRTKLTWWIENLRFCNSQTFSQLKPQTIIQRDASLTGGSSLQQGSNITRWSKEERASHINKLELLVIKLDSFKLEHRSSILPYQYDFRSAPKNKTGIRSSPDSDYTSLEYPTIMVHRTFNPFCYGTSAAATWKRHSDKSKKYCSPIDGGELTDTSSLVGFTKTLSCEAILKNASHIIIHFR